MQTRRDTVPDHSFVHVYFRCNNKQYFLRPKSIKNHLLQLMGKYKSKYGIKIFDFCIMDNHAHFYMWTPSSSALGYFMQCVLSQVAFGVNRHFKRDSQVFRARYKSPVLSSPNYALGLIKYIYSNRVKTGGLPPDQDPYCSAHWRLHQPFQLIENPVTEDDNINNDLALLIDDYTDASVVRFARSREFFERMVENALRDCLHKIDYGLYRCSHTIGSPQTILERKRTVRAARQSRDPPR